MPEEVFETNWPKIILTAALGLGLLAAAAYAGYWYGTESAKVKEQISGAPSPIPIPTQSTTDPTAGWKTYTNTVYGYSVKYPANLEIEDRSNQLPPSTIFLTDRTKQVPYDGGSEINPYAFIEVKNSHLSLMDCVNDPKNNLEYVGEKQVGENEFVIAREKLGMAAGKFDRYLIKNGNNIITVANSFYAVDGQTFNQILSTFKILD